MRSLAAALVLCASAGCGDAGTTSLGVSWQFADGRRCDDAGAFTVSLRSGGKSLLDVACEAGQEPSAVMLPAVPAGGFDLDALGESAAGDELYRGHLHLDAVPASVTVTLFATGAR